jgi:hypothetical protein
MAIISGVLLRGRSRRTSDMTKLIMELSIKSILLYLKFDMGFFKRRISS